MSTTRADDIGSRRPASAPSAAPIGDELLRAVRIALGDAALDDCAIADADGDGRISIGDLVQAVRAALDGCQPPALSG